MAQRLIGVTFRIRWVCYVGAILCTFLLPFQVAAIGGVPAGHVASHGLERDIIYSDGTGEGAGYFTFMEGIPGPFFAGLPSEATAFFTFRTTRFSTGIIQNGNVKALLHPPGSFTIYLNTAPMGSWNDLGTFSAGQQIAIVEYGATQDIAPVSPNAGSVQIGYTSARLVDSSDFQFQGHRFNLNDLFPNGVTIAFITNPTPINNNLPLIFSLGFTAFAIGADTDQTE